MPASRPGCTVWAMIDIADLKVSTKPRRVDAGAQVMRRAERLPVLSFVETGRLALGIARDGHLMNQVGVLEGPCWLDLSAAVLQQASAMDAVAATELTLIDVALEDVREMLRQMEPTARRLLVDMALAHRRQTDYALSRLGKDAESRCAEWLLSHAVRRREGVLAIELVERKRSIAAHLGITPETFSRVLRHLRDQSLISGSGRLLHVTNAKALRAVARV